VGVSREGGSLERDERWVIGNAAQERDSPAILIWSAEVRNGTQLLPHERETDTKGPLTGLGESETTVAARFVAVDLTLIEHSLQLELGYERFGLSFGFRLRGHCVGNLSTSPRRRSSV
jgi:hypothetical protein